MATIAFVFNSPLALRIANLITGDIERLEREAFGTKTNWQSKFDRPFKAHYANDLATRAKGNTRALTVITDKLPEYEKRASDYMNDPTRRGRPLTAFVNVDDPTDAQTDDTQTEQEEQSAMETATDDLTDAVAEILNTTEPKVASAKPAHTAVKAPTKAPDNPAVNPDAQKALQDLLAALAPPAQKVEIDEALVRQIARDEATKAIKPTVIHITRAEQSEPQDLGVQHRQFPALLTVLRTGFPVWLPGPAGSGKTTAAKNAAKALDIAFHHTGAVDNVYQLLGFRDAAGHYHRTSFREAYEHGGVFLWDEVDASNPTALVAFNAAIENGECVFPDAVIPKHPDCYFVAAANTYGTGATHEYVGRTKIDAATVDRFVMLDWQYDEILERAIAGDNEWTHYVQKVRAAVKAAGIKHIVSPRASIRGNALLAAGMDRDSVIMATVRKGLSEDQWNNVRNKVRA